MRNAIDIVDDAPPEGADLAGYLSSLTDRDLGAAWLAVVVSAIREDGQYSEGMVSWLARALLVVKSRLTTPNAPRRKIDSRWSDEMIHALVLGHAMSGPVDLRAVLGVQDRVRRAKAIIARSAMLELCEVPTRSNSTPFRVGARLRRGARRARTRQAAANPSG